jgi:hypothetical protein
VRIIFSEYCKGKAAPHVANFVEARLGDFQNPKMNLVLELCRCFNPAWESALDIANRAELKEALDSIVANRHRIAHGEAVTLSFARLKPWYDQAWAFIELLDQTVR